MTEQGTAATISKALVRYSNTVRGTISGWDFKTYLLTMMLYRFMSDAIERYMSDLLGADYADAADGDVTPSARQTALEELGYFIYPTQLFSRVLSQPA